MAFVPPVFHTRVHFGIEPANPARLPGGCAHPISEKIMFTCRNQPCGANWEVSDVDIHNEGQGLLFRCPQCGARNRVIRHEAADGAVTYEQDDSIPLKSEPASAPKTASKPTSKYSPRGAPKSAPKSAPRSAPPRTARKSTPTKRGR
ncbi:hypothetical protein AWB81_00234 [Caballeronia arationis]|nr:hypothetical protein AWB81_00234 [Caballeronia arationis]